MMNATNDRCVTFGIIIGNRGFFPDHLAKSGREELLDAVDRVGYAAVALGSSDSKHGAVETREEAKKCADLFHSHRDKIDGIIISLPNFGDERGVADTLRMSDLGVPVLVQATPDTPSKMSIRYRRDSFCGKMSVCNNLRQYGIPYSLTTMHTESTDSEHFRRDLDWFAAVCRVVRGLRRLRIGAIGARPSAFNTVRFSEKILEGNGISVEPIDLSEILGRIARMNDKDDAAVRKMRAIKSYMPTIGIPNAALLKMAKLGAVIDRWMEETDVAISAVQCWTSMEEYLGVVPCDVQRL
jgi:L-fucose isomerase-like protein